MSSSPSPTTTPMTPATPATPMTPKLKETLDSKVFVTVATLRPDGSPHQSVVWVGRDGDDLFFVTAVDKVKIRNLRRDPRLSVTVNPPDEPYGYAVITGTARLESADSQARMDELSLKYTDLTYAEHNPEVAAALPELITVYVTPEKIASRFL